jgi:hypothetical protein
LVAHIAVRGSDTVNVAVPLQMVLGGRGMPHRVTLWGVTDHSILLWRNLSRAI